MRNPSKCGQFSPSKPLEQLKMALVHDKPPAPAPPEPASSDTDGRDLKTWQKGTILFIVSWNTFVVTSTSTSLLIATPEIASTFRTSVEIINATNAPVLIAMGCSSF